MENEEPIVVIKPEYKFIYEFLNRSGITTVILLLLLIPVIRIGIMKYYLILMAIYIIFLIISTIFNKKNYASKTCKFYEDKLIYINDFIRHEEKEINYKNVKEIKYRQYFLQYLFKMGDIYISTNSGKFFDNGIFIYGISNIKEKYTEIKKIINGEM